MKSGAPAFGTPAHLQATLGAGQLARHVGLPWRSGGGSAGNAPDAQGAQEAVMGLWGSLLAGSTLVVHAAGWQEGGLTFGYEKLIVDMEAVQTLAELCTPPDGHDLALDAIAEVAPGGHFFAAAHTMARYETAFYEPLLADLRNHGQWSEAGAPLTHERAVAVWQARLAAWRRPDACDGVDEALAPFVERRTREGGSPPLD
jgi:trimethylamine--corrinoid protein Co-methyltransferase